MMIIRDLCAVTVYWSLHGQSSPRASAHCRPSQPSSVASTLFGSAGGQVPFSPPVDHHRLSIVSGCRCIALELSVRSQCLLSLSSALGWRHSCSGVHSLKLLSDTVLAHWLSCATISSLGINDRYLSLFKKFVITPWFGLSKQSTGSFKLLRRARVWIVAIKNTLWVVFRWCCIPILI
jgi:hypothetical protein